MIHNNKNQNDSSLDLTDHNKERQIYNRLVGIFQIIQGNTSSRRINTSHIWEKFNSAIEELEQLGHKNFTDSKITQDMLHEWNGPALDTQLFLSQLSSVLWEMVAKFSFISPQELISTFPQSFMQQVNNQQQSQNQQIKITIKNKIDLLDKVVNDEMSSEQVTLIKQELLEFRKNPNSWKNGQKLIKSVLGFGKDIASQTISSILAFYLTK